MKYKKQIVGIIDYGNGNTKSLIRSFEYFNTKSVIVDTPKKIKKCDKFVLPGVGNFSYSIKHLIRSNLFDEIKLIHQKENFLFGICLGMQVLFEQSEESRSVRGLGIIPGKVVKMNNFKKKIDLIPHIGWNKITQSKKSKFGNLLKQKNFYFSHSYICEPTSDLNNSFFKYGGKSQVASINYKNIIGTQFHPEISGLSGLKLIDYFLKQ